MRSDGLPEEKTVKVKIPKRQHIILHSARVLTGKTISEMLEEALEAYFDEGCNPD